MSTNIDQAYVQAYTNAITMFYQQQGSKLRGRVREKASVGEYEFFERIAPTTAAKKTVRHADTMYTDTVHSRRRAEKSDYEWSDLVDQMDLHRILIDPTSAYVTNGAYAMGRAFDAEVIAAFNADAMEGKTGGTTTVFPAGQVVAAGTTNMNFVKLLDAKLLFDSADVEEGDLQLVISPSGCHSLLQQDKVTSADFASMKALVTGGVSSFAGFNFVKSTLLPVALNIRSCFAWHPLAMGMGVGQEIQTSVDRLPHKSNSIQILLQGAFGAVRILDEGVVQIDIDESAGPV